MELSVADNSGNTLSRTDSLNGDKNASDWGYLAGGDGTYTLKVQKIAQENGSSAGTMTFRIQHECVAADNSKTKTSKPRLIK